LNGKELVSLRRIIGSKCCSEVIIQLTVMGAQNHKKLLNGLIHEISTLKERESYS
jgi:hypothetical protein